MEGWISIHRRIRENWIWKSSEPFDKRSAWTDLLLSANHKNNNIPFENDFIEIERGQFLTSLKQLANRWKWSRHKVSDFLNQLEQDNMIVQVRDTKKTLISIVNYDKYQPKLEQKWDQNGTSVGTQNGTHFKTTEIVENTEIYPMENNERDMSEDTRRDA